LAQIGSGFFGSGGNFWEKYAGHILNIEGEIREKYAGHNLKKIDKKNMPATVFVDFF